MLHVYFFAHVHIKIWMATVTPLKIIIGGGEKVAGYQKSWQHVWDRSFIDSKLYLLQYSHLLLHVWFDW